MDVIDNAIGRRFEMMVDDEVSFVDYRKDDGRLVLLHAEVPPALEGRGIGKTLVRGVLDEARKHGVKVVPLCGFVAAFIKRNPEYLDLVE